MKSANCSGGKMLNETSYLVPTSGPGNSGALQEISHNAAPPVLQFSVVLRPLYILS